MNEDFTTLVRDAVINTAPTASSPAAHAAMMMTPEEVSKRFFLELSKGLNDLIAQKLSEGIAAVLANPSIKTEINGTNWLQEYLLGKPIGIHYYWPTPGYNSPMTIQHHMATATSEFGDGMSIQRVSIGISAAITF